MIMNFYNSNPIDVITDIDKYPQTLYSVNFDYCKPITYKKVANNKDQLDEFTEDCGMYGYSLISEEEYNYYNRILTQEEKP